MVVSGSLYAAEVSDPILVVDSGGHKGAIWDLVVTSDKRYLISAAIDKTIRVWDIKSKREVRKILGQVGSDFGQIYAIALSADNRWLAVGGFLAGKDAQDAEDRGAIRIYDFRSGQLIKLLRSHTATVFDLAFNADGSRLISGSADNTVKVWDVRNNFRMIRTLKGHSRHIYAVGVLPNEQIVSVGLDKNIFVWKDGHIVSRYTHDHMLISLAISRKAIAVSGPGGKDILVLDHKLNVMQDIMSETVPVGLAFSPSGRWLLAGTHTVPRSLALYDVQNDFREQARMKVSNVVRAVTFIDNDTLVSGGAERHEIRLWDTSGDTKWRIAGAGNKVYAVGLDETGIAWGNVWEAEAYKHSSPLASHFDLRNLSIDAVQGTPVRISTHWDDWSLAHRPGGTYGKTDATLVISQDGKEAAAVTRGTAKGYRHRSYGFTADGMVLSGGGLGKIYAYDRKGKELAEFIGHEADVGTIASDGQWAVSGSADQTIKLWNLDDVRSGKKKIHPELSLFIDQEGEWVAWTESGYFAASAKGDRYVGFHINHGQDRAAEFVPASQFYESLYRPDIVSLVWETGSETAAITKAKQRRRTQRVEVKQLLPPRIILQSPLAQPLRTADDQVKVVFCVEPMAAEPVTEIEVLLNGRPLTERGIKINPKGSQECIEQVVALTFEEHQVITLQARNRHASANPVVLEIERKGVIADRLYQPDLYLLAIGVSDYSDNNFDLALAHKDAKAIGEIFKQQKSLFRSVNTRVLLDAEATKDNILDALEWLDRNSTQRDLVVIFVAGHGVNDDRGNYYFLPHDANKERLRRTGVRWHDFKDVVTNLPGMTLLMADTCHSGNIMGRRRGLGDDITAAIKSITAAGTGQVVMTAATGSSVSIEDVNWGHGAFTKAFVEGLDGKADYDSNRIITIKELDLYVTSRVKALTNGRQKPTTIIPGSIPDFAVGVRR